MFYRSLRGQPYKYRDDVYKGQLLDFPFDITVLSLKITVLNENEQPTGPADGMSIADASINNPGVLVTFMQDCYNHQYILPWLPHQPASAWPAPGPDIFSLRDGSQPKTGMWSGEPLQTGFLEFQLLATNLETRTRKLMIKVELDYVAGKPEPRALKTMLLPGVCEKIKFQKDPLGGPKRFVLKPPHSMSVKFDGEFLAIEPLVMSTDPAATVTIY